jgi:hypothetical protein
MRLGCLLSLIITLAPRLVLLFLWLFTSRVSQAFEGFLLPLLGFIFLPFATLAYVLVWNPVGGVSGWAWLLVVGGLLFDLGTYAISGYANRSRIYRNDQGEDMSEA